MNEPRMIDEALPEPPEPLLDDIDTFRPTLSLSSEDKLLQEDLEILKKYDPTDFSIRDALNSRQSNMEAKRETQRRRKSGPAAVTSPASYFRADRVEAIADQYPDAAPSELVRILDQEWNTLSDEERQKYERLSDQDHENFLQERKNYLPKIHGGRMKRHKKRKHPDAPKHPKSPYLFFAADRRAELKKENPNESFSTISSMLGKEYKEMSPELKEKYQKIADDDKIRYKLEKEQWESTPRAPVSEPSPRGKTSIDFILEEMRGKKRRNPLSPRHALSSYLFFVALNRTALSELVPDMSFSDVARLLGVLWKNISSQDRRKFDILAAVDKRRYEEEKQTHQPALYHAEPSTDGSDTTEPSMDPSAHRLKKPVSAYAIWAAEERAAVLEEHPEIDRKELTKILRQNWKELTPFEKLPYLELEKQERESEESPLPLLRQIPQLPQNYTLPALIPVSLQVQSLEEESFVHSGPNNVLEWSAADIGRFIAGLGFPQYAESFVQSGISGKEFVGLTTGDLKRNFGISKLGERKKIKEAIDQKLV